MSNACCCSSGLQLFCDWIVPEGIIHRQPCVGDFYQKNPVMSRVFIAPVALFSGIVKVFLFPLICVVGVVVMPIIALIRACKREKDAGDWLKAWSFCILGVAGAIAFLGVTCYYLPLITSSALLVTILAVSIVVHVHKMMKEPIAPLPLIE